MAYKRIAGIKDIVTVIDLGGARTPARVALALADRAGAHLTGLAPIVDITAAAAVGGPVALDLLAQATAQAEKAAADAEAAFAELARRAGIAAESGTFRMMDGVSADLVARARLADLAVIGQDDPDAPEPGRTVLIETLLFEAGVPLLVVPYIAGESLPARRALVAWDGSLPAARAVRAALPFLAAADDVRVVIVDGERRREPGTGGQAALFLARHGLEVTVERTAAAGGDVGGALLNHAADSGADLLVMGAYGHSRFREFVLGGATRTLLETMTVPVLMAH
jgi:nucleotide-binding universal stress UspA family protein